MRRELKSVRTGAVLGAITDRPRPLFEGDAGQVLRGLRAQMGDDDAVAVVLEDGWSNGYLFFDEPIPDPTAVLTAAAEVHTGAMVALIPAAEHAGRLAVDGGEPVDQLHVTLAYLGEAAALEHARAAITDQITAAAAGMAPVEASGFAVSLFNPDGEEPCIVLGLSGSGLDPVHDAVHTALGEAAAAAPFEMPEQHSPWIPHLTLIYTGDHDQAAALVDRTGPVVFDRIRVAFAGENTDIPLEAAMTVPVILPAANGAVTGTYANTAPWEAVLTVEGIESGDGREFALDALGWDTPPLPLMWQKVSSHGSGYDEAVGVGRIDEVWRVPIDATTAHIMGRGVIDLDNPDGAEVHRQLAAGMVRGNSVDVDSVKEADIEFVYPEEPEAEEEEGIEILAIFFLGEPEKVIFHKGRIRGTTIVQYPAFTEAQFYLIDDAGNRIDPAGAEPAPPAEGDDMTAAAYTITLSDLPPAEWFDEPVGEPLQGAFTITDAGRVFGWLAPAGVAHRGFRGQRNVYVPRNQNYSEFMNKPVLVTGADGQPTRLYAGNVTMGCNHAAPADPYAAEHYENTCSVFARIRVGESAGGTWVAGALLPDVDAAQVSRAMACVLSGHWQGGFMKAALLVPVEGFPLAQPHASVRIAEGALVASAVPVRFRRYAAVRPDLRPALERLARSLGRDSMSRLALLRDRHPREER